MASTLSQQPALPIGNTSNTTPPSPPALKNMGGPKVTTTLWEDEGTLCFQVEANGICVARREDNNMVNGTKLLNVAGMTRGRRDGILKTEKNRHVVKVGAMHLKGVWIPFERALNFANKEKIVQLLYPLFVQDIKSLLYNPSSAYLSPSPVTNHYDTTAAGNAYYNSTPQQFDNKHYSMPPPTPPIDNNEPIPPAQSPVQGFFQFQAYQQPPQQYPHNINSTYIYDYNNRQYYTNFNTNHNNAYFAPSQYQHHPHPLTTYHQHQPPVTAAASYPAPNIPDIHSLDDTSHESKPPLKRIKPDYD